MDVKCDVCGRPLQNERSRKLGRGPVCDRKVKAKERMLEEEMMTPTIVDQEIAYESMRKITRAVGVRRCHCGEELFGVLTFDHSGGVDIPGFGEPQWLFLHCEKCKYDTAIWKLGVNAEEVLRDIPDQ